MNCFFCDCTEAVPVGEERKTIYDRTVPTAGYPWHRVYERDYRCPACGNKWCEQQIKDEANNQIEMALGTD